MLTAVLYNDRLNCSWEHRDVVYIVCSIRQRRTEWLSRRGCWWTRRAARTLHRCLLCA